MFFVLYILLLLKVIDSRPKGRFDGTAPEPNKSLHSGHILGTTNVPFTELIRPDSKTLKSKEAIKEGTWCAILFCV